MNRANRISDMVLLKRSLKLRRFVRCNRFGAPLIVVLGEQLDAIAANLRCPFGSQVISAGDGLVSTEDGHWSELRMAKSDR